MSRIGKYPVAVPSGVQVTISGQTVSAKGKMGALSLLVSPELEVSFADNKVTVKPREATRRSRTLWGTARANIANIMKGVSEGFNRRLTIEGVGFKAAVQGKELVLNIGFSHEVRYLIPEGVAIKAEKPTILAISGIDRQKVGQVAAEIRGMKKPEPYKGKGIMYEGEQIRRKEGKKK